MTRPMWWPWRGQTGPPYIGLSRCSWLYACGWQCGDNCWARILLGLGAGGIVLEARFHVGLLASAQAGSVQIAVAGGVRSADARVVPFQVRDNIIPIDGVVVLADLAGRDVLRLARLQQLAGGGGREPVARVGGSQHGAEEGREDDRGVLHLERKSVLVLKKVAGVADGNWYVDTLG